MNRDHAVINRKKGQYEHGVDEIGNDNNNNNISSLNNNSNNITSRNSNNSLSFSDLKSNFQGRGVLISTSKDSKEENGQRKISGKCTLKESIRDKKDHTGKNISIINVQIDQNFIRLTTMVAIQKPHSHTQNKHHNLKAGG